MTAAATTGRVAEAATIATDVPACRAWAAPPCRRRGLWLVFVATCVHCGSGHGHRVGNPTLLLAGQVTKACPVSGEQYRLSPVNRRREARRPIRSGR